MSERDEYAVDIIRALQRGEETASTRAVKFLKRRLTEAAIHGCHHCHEGEAGTPCWWCGLKNRKRA